MFTFLFVVLYFVLKEAPQNWTSFKPTKLGSALDRTLTLPLAMNFQAQVNPYSKCGRNDRLGSHPSRLTMKSPTQTRAMILFLNREEEGCWERPVCVQGNEKSTWGSSERGSKYCAKRKHLPRSEPRVFTISTLLATSTPSRRMPNGCCLERFPP